MRDMSRQTDPQEDRVLAQCRDSASELIEAVRKTVDMFTEGQHATDDRTPLVARIS